MPAVAALPLAAKIGIGLGGALLSRDASDTSIPTSPATQLQADIARQLFQQTDPLRRSLIDRSQQFVSGNLDVTNSPVFSGFKSGVESSFDSAKDRIIDITPRGGALIEALTNLEGERARTLSQGRGAIAGDELSRAMSLGTGIESSISGLGSAGAIQAALAQAEANRQSGMFSALGAGLGALAGNK